MDVDDVCYYEVWANVPGGVYWTAVVGVRAVGCCRWRCALRVVYSTTVGIVVVGGDSSVGGDVVVGAAVAGGVGVDID
eukprot:7186147-Lingulodinium_polyedra.AAC.1